MAKGLLYSLVARGQVVLAAYNPRAGNFEEVALQCLQSFRNPEPKFTVRHEQSSTDFHFLVRNGFTYLAVSDTEFSRLVTFGFLERVAVLLEGQYQQQASTAAAHGLDRTFGPRLKQEQEYCSAHPEEFSRTASAQAKVDAVSQVMQQNLVLLFQREGHLNKLKDQSDTLALEAANFDKKAHRLRCEMCKQYYKMWAVLVVILVFLALIIFLCVCFAGGNNCTK